MTTYAALSSGQALASQLRSARRHTQGLRGSVWRACWRHVGLTAALRAIPVTPDPTSPGVVPVNLQRAAR